MTQFNLYAVMDKVAGEYGPLFPAINDGIAIRQTCSLLKDSICSEDYMLCQVGFYDTSNAFLEGVLPREIDFHITLFKMQEKK